MNSEQTLYSNYKQELSKPKRKASKPYIEQVSALFEVSFKEMKLPTKKHAISKARGFLWFLLCIDGHWSLTEAAKKLGNFHHTSALHQIRKVSNELYKTHMKATLEEIREAHEKAKG